MTSSERDVKRALRTPQIGTAELVAEPKRLAYADPPYLGCCRLYDHEHNDGGPMPWDGRCWDRPDTHRLLLRYLGRYYDGWAYSLSSPSLFTLAPMVANVPGVRCGSWDKSFAAFKRNVRIAYAWEPLFWVPARDSSADGAPVGRDFIVEPITMRRHFTGAKPGKVCRWVLDLMGYIDGDEVDDLFPGSHTMTHALAEGVLL